MKKRTALKIVLILLITLAAYSAEASQKIAFGHFTNASKDLNYDYLETMFPNSFANSIKNTFGIKIIKNKKVESLLKKKNLKLERSYKFQELPDLCDKIGSDFFVWGSFSPLPDKNIKIDINFYMADSKKIFTFSNTGKLEVEIFKLVDRITQILALFMSEDMFYKSAFIPKNSRIAVMSNLSGDELNYIYISLMNAGYEIASTNANSLLSGIDRQLIERCLYISSKDNSYDFIPDKKSSRVLAESQEGIKGDTPLMYVNRLYDNFEIHYFKTKMDVMERIARFYNADLVLIVGLNKAKNNAWVRCINLKTRELIWMQSNITASNLSLIGKKIADNMGSKTLVPVKGQ
ncbi:MAG: hypothetical protein MUD12_05095 [Spirochaetes bacterium]|jgi:hypothetical protein|nr:hypothetical protein [Spirochaetota bacterium]